MPSQSISNIFKEDNKQLFKEKVERIRFSPKNNQRRDISLFYEDGEVKSLVYTDYDKVYYFEIPNDKNEKSSFLFNKIKALPYYKKDSKVTFTES